MEPDHQVQILSLPLTSPVTLGKLLISDTYLNFLICTMVIITGLPQRVVERIIVNHCKPFKTVPEL